MDLIVHQAYGSDTSPLETRKRLWKLGQAPLTGYFQDFPTRAELIEGLATVMAGKPDENFLELEFGIAACHPQDNYSKRRGVAEARLKILPQEMRVISISWTPYGHFLVRMTTLDFSTALELTWPPKAIRPEIKIKRAGDYSALEFNYVF